MAQADLLPAEPRPTEWGRLLFALLVSGEALARLAAVVAEARRSHGVTGPMRPAGRLHVTVTAVREGGRDPVAAARRAAGRVWFAPFRLTLTHLMSMGGTGRRALALANPEGNEGWADLMLRLDAQLRREGLAQPRRAPGLPHLTLLYDEREVPARALATPVALDFDSFALVRGAVGAPAYRAFGRWDGREARS